MRSLIDSAKEKLKSTWDLIDHVKYINQQKTLEAFQSSAIQNAHYHWVTGYGYDDLGKDKLDELYARYFCTEAALVRPNLVSGTHAICSAILGNLNARDAFISIGQPYDTLQTVFAKISKKYNFQHVSADFVNPNNIDQVENLLSPLFSNSKFKLASLQRSRGYEWRESYTIDQLRKLISIIRKIDPEIIIFVDNCYGEFTQILEPTEIGADLIAGSLIKNPGAGIVAAGAYIAGKKNLVDNAAESLTAPGIGAHGACMFDQTRLMMQGLFMAPLIVSEALKGVSLAAYVFAELGFETLPNYDSERNDIIQSIKFGNREKLINFCKIVQNNCPVNSIFSPEPAEISGYDDQIIMASGSFIEGSSIELSCDGPLREPYIAYFQGGLSYAHTEIVLAKFIDNIDKF